MLEKHHVPRRSQRARWVLTFFAQDTAVLGELGARGVKFATLRMRSVIITNDAGIKARALISQYARRMTIEQRLAEIIQAFCTDALSSTATRRSIPRGGCGDEARASMIRV